MAAVLAVAGTVWAVAGGSASAATTNQPSGAAPLSLTPPMGYNPWAHFQCNISESLMLSEANALVSTGLAAAGYKTVTPDDCWMQASRDSNGNLQANTTTFPDGMAYLGTQLHNLGLKFGIYEDLGTTTCAGNAGSYGHYEQDANLFASWNVDYLKLDGCNVPGGTNVQDYDTDLSQMSAALAATGRPITYEEATPAYFKYWDTADWWNSIQPLSQWGQLWREGEDIALYNPSNPNASRWSSILLNYDYNTSLARYAKPGAFNDPDMIIGGDPGVTLDETKSQMALWSMESAPLILGSDVTQLSSASIAVLGNADVIAIDQDPLVHQAIVVSQNGSSDVLLKPLSNGDRAIALFNRSGSSTGLSVTAAQLGLNDTTGCSYSVKDLWNGSTTSSSGNFSATVPSHGTDIMRVTPSSVTCGKIVPTGQITGNIVGSGNNNVTTACLDNYGGSSSDGNPIDMWSCNGQYNQAWTEPGDGTIRVQGSCLDITGGSTSPGTALELYHCVSGDAAQQWVVYPDGTLRNPNSGLCAAVGTTLTSNGSPLVVTATCGANQGSQLWAVPGNTMPTGAVTGVGSTLCLDNSGGSATDGNPIIVWACQGSYNQSWTLPGDGTVRVQGMCLDTPSNTLGTYLELYDCNGSSGEQWTYSSDGGLLENPSAGLCLDVYGGSYTPGASVDTWNCKSTTNQLWTLPI